MASEAVEVIEAELRVWGAGGCELVLEVPAWVTEPRAEPRDYFVFPWSAQARCLCRVRCFVAGLRLLCRLWRTLAFGSLIAANAWSRLVKSGVKSVNEALAP